MKISEIGIALIAIGIFGLLFLIPLSSLLILPGIILLVIDKLFITKKCPYCYEKIDKKSHICPYCKRKLNS